MFAIGNEDMLAALEHMEENKLIYYDAHCPKCRRANRVERARMERFFPEWKKAIKAMEKESTQAEAPAKKTATGNVTVKAAASQKAAGKAVKKTADKMKPAAASAKKTLAKRSSPRRTASTKGKTAGTKKK